MPLNVRRLLGLFLLFLPIWVTIYAQTDNQAEANAQRISKARTLIATRNLVAAAFELEKTRRETDDEATLNAANVLLVGIYLEQADYQRVQNILEDSFQKYKSKKNGCYFSVSGQILKGARAQLERYKQLGLRLSDAKLPKEISVDLDRWRSMLEGMLEQTKQLAVLYQRTTEAYVLLEDIANTRVLLARDEYDAARWKNAVEDVRELVADAQTKIAEVEETPVGNAPVIAQNPTPTATTATSGITPKVQPANNNVAVKDAPTPNLNPQNIGTAPKSETSSITASLDSGFSSASENSDVKLPGKKDEVKLKPVSEKISAPETPTLIEKNNEKTTSVVPSLDERMAQIGRESEVTSEKEAVKKAAEEVSANTVSSAPTTNSGGVEKAELMTVGSLVDYATRKVAPIYPPIAKNTRVSGIVRVEVIVNEEGNVSTIQGANGPELLKRAATDAVKRWKFRPILKDGQPVKVAGFINFNFTL